MHSCPLLRTVNTLPWTSKAEGYTPFEWIFSVEEGSTFAWSSFAEGGMPFAKKSLKEESIAGISILLIFGYFQD